MKRKIHLTMKQRLQVYEVLKALCKKHGDYAVYDKGWNDRTVAELATSQLEFPVHTAHVAHIRLEMMGQTQKVAKSGEFEELKGQLLDLLARVTLLESKVGRLLSEKTIQETFRLGEKQS